jgi:thioesterase domain-containing protein
MLVRDDAEAVICTLWERLLGVPVEAADDFFDLGGYSLLVATVVTEGRKAGLTITSADMFTHRTPAKLAAALAGTRLTDAQTHARTAPPDFASVWAQARDLQEPTQPLTPLAGGQGTPVFCFHWDLGNIRFMRDLVDDFRCGRRVFGTEAIGLWNRARPTLSVNATAGRYLREIRLLQPQGPYSLLGLCSGGRIAYEVARGLRELGEDIQCLALVNTKAPGSSGVNPEWGLRELYEFRLDVLRHWFGLDDLHTNQVRLVDEMKRQAWLDEQTDPADLYWRQLIWAAEVYAQEHYRPPSFDGRVTLFQSGDMRLDVPWRGFAADVECHTVAASGTLPLLRDTTVATILRDRLACDVD